MRLKQESGMQGFSPLRRLLIGTLTVLLMSVLSPAHAYTGLFIFGDSLSDTGNNAIFLGAVDQVITDNTYIPDNPYLPSERYSNAEVWTAPFAAGIGQAVSASLAGGNVYAYGGARTRDASPSNVPPLREQVKTYLLAAGGVADPEALYVIAGGGNNARDTLDALDAGAPLLKTIASGALRFGMDVQWMVKRLQAAGAKHFVVWNVPDLAVAPAVIATGPDAVMAAGLVVKSMNSQLMARLKGETDVVVFDVFTLFDQVVQDKGAYFLDNVTDACGAIAGCDPSKYLFWDGIHPTSAGHEIIANEFLRLLNPPTAAQKASRAGAASSR
jgi:outer membrane lipase/esterase